MPEATKMQDKSPKDSSQTETGLLETKEQDSTTTAPSIDPIQKLRLFQAAMHVIDSLRDDADVVSMQSILAPGYSLPSSKEDVTVIFRVELFAGGKLIKGFGGLHQIPSLLAEASIPEAHSLFENLLTNSLLRPCTAQFTQVLNNIINSESSENAFQVRRIPGSVTGNLSANL
jgi:hypothetical protein